MSAQLDLFAVSEPEAATCECEHACHWKDPLAHAYGQVRADYGVVRTAYGRFALCEECARTCHRDALTGW